MNFSRSTLREMILQVTIFAAAICVCLIVSPAGAEPKWQLPEGIRSAEVNGYDMAYQETGSGAPVVLVHGALTDYRFWDVVVPEIAKYYRVVAVSLRHYYPEKWDRTGSDFSFEQHAADVVALIKTLNLGKVHLVGHSRGGTVVLSVAKTHPEVIKTLTLADATGLDSLLPNTPEDQELVNATRERIETLQRNLANGDDELAAQTFVDSLIGPGTWAAVSAEQKRRLFENLGTAAQMSVPPSLNCEEVAKFDFPILLVNGEKSPMNYPAGSAAMRKCKALAAPIIVPNAGHNMFRNNPPFFNAALLGFLAHD